ncbi:OmpA family protein [Celerinatantimonas sp. MCCC 1A17872]|uniref:OmpA family protein n=1 Tax=Celerinatantimonas sp. MCCC 1A17872 TaxID=3177514 RepID=UPI0038C3C3E8
MANLKLFTLKIISVISLTSAMCVTSYASSTHGFATYKIATERDNYQVKLLNIENSGQEHFTGTTTHPITVRFAFDQSRLGREQKQKLHGVVNLLDNKTTLLVKVTGFTDSVGSIVYNQQLGLRRAQAVQTYMQQLGFSSKQITIASKGELDPVATNKTQSGRQQNRRALIIFE